MSVCSVGREKEWGGRRSGTGGGVGREEARYGRRSGTGGGVALVDFSIRNCEEIFNENNFIKMSICEELKSSHWQHSVSEIFFRYLNV